MRQKRVDNLFQERLFQGGFRFDEKVASLFNNMVDRSVPHYRTLQILVARIIKKLVQPNSNIYDIGCSTGNTFHHLDEKGLPESVQYVGIDESEPMIKEALQNAQGKKAKFILGDVFDTILSNASIAVMFCTLMFIRPLKRRELVKRIYESLNPGGAFILVEKIIDEDRRTNELYIDQYYDYKRDNGYSEEEILNKRIALENVLIPFTDEENLELLSDFESVTTLAQFMNFKCYLAIKAGETPEEASASEGQVEELHEEEEQPSDLTVDKDTDTCNAYPYDWKMSAEWRDVQSNPVDYCIPKVMTTFSCTGGSSLGYKRAGMEIVANNEFDSRYNDIYLANHNPKYSFPEKIQTLRLREDLPEELFHLDILDGSPPCKLFSTNGLRERAWGQKREYRKGTGFQKIEELFFDFIALAEKLGPKVVVAENVKGLQQGNAKKYLLRIYQSFDRAGYYVRHYLFDSSEYGVPQKRERVIFVAVRKDLARYIDPELSENYTLDLSMFDEIIDGRKIDLNQIPQPLKAIDIAKEPAIPYESIQEIDPSDYPSIKSKKSLELWDKCEEGKSFSSVHEKKHRWNDRKLSTNRPVPTIMPTNQLYHHNTPRKISKLELERAGSWPQDFDYGKLKPQEVIGRAVPPTLMAKIAQAIKDQYLLPIYKGLGIPPSTARMKPSNVKTKVIVPLENDLTRYDQLKEAANKSKKSSTDIDPTVVAAKKSYDEFSMPAQYIEAMKTVQKGGYEDFPDPKSKQPKDKYYYKRYYQSVKVLRKMSNDDTWFDVNISLLEKLKSASGSKGYAVLEELFLKLKKA